jgi:hypothetical protein
MNWLMDIDQVHINILNWHYNRSEYLSLTPLMYPRSSYQVLRSIRGVKLNYVTHRNFTSSSTILTSTCSIPIGSFNVNLPMYLERVVAKFSNYIEEVDINLSSILTYENLLSLFFPKFYQISHYACYHFIVF